MPTKKRTQKKTKRKGAAKTVKRRVTKAERRRAFLTTVTMIIILAAGIYIGMNYADRQTIYTYANVTPYFTNATFDVSAILGNDYTEVTPSIDYVTLMFSSDCYVLMFDVTDDQAFSINNGLEGVIRPRPMPHDVIKEVLDNFGISVLAARIDRFKDDVYYAKLLMQRGENVLDLDVRPSDATAISVRTGNPIYVKTSILRNQGYYIC